MMQDRTELTDLVEHECDRVNELIWGYGAWAARCGFVNWEQLLRKQSTLSTGSIEARNGMQCQHSACCVGQAMNPEEQARERRAEVSAIRVSIYQPIVQSAATDQSDGRVP